MWSMSEICTQEIIVRSRPLRLLAGVVGLAESFRRHIRLQQRVELAAIEHRLEAVAAVAAVDRTAGLELRKAAPLGVERMGLARGGLVLDGQAAGKEVLRVRLVAAGFGTELVKWMGLVAEAAAGRVATAAVVVMAEHYYLDLQSRKQQLDRKGY
jgi:hypothetical protein